jgi:hypothetical protein
MAVKLGMGEGPVKRLNLCGYLAMMEIQGYGYGPVKTNVRVAQPRGRDRGKPAIGIAPIADIHGIHARSQIGRDRS